MTPERFEYLKGWARDLREDGHSEGAAMGELVAEIQRLRRRLEERESSESPSPSTQTERRELEREARTRIRRLRRGVDLLQWDRKVLATMLRLEREAAASSESPGAERPGLGGSR